MSETDWREILSFSQRELIQADKEKLCESLSWMEADDIELNFSDLKTLFRLAQDILKYKSEQVNNLHGQLETVQRNSVKSKTKGSYTESPSRGSDSFLETIAHQEEVIKANKEILEELYADIAELEEKKKILDDKDNVDRDSESSRDVLSEINEVATLENEITMKNRHIRKLLSDVKVLEEENTKLKEKLTVFKNKLTEATNLIENLTEQLLALNNESSQLKDILGKSEESKSHLSIEIESLRKELFEKDINKESMYHEIKSKVQHWKNIVRSKKAEVKTLSNENAQLKENLSRMSLPATPSKTRHRDAEERKIKEMQLKLTEASKQIEQSADLIEQLKTENNQLKSLIEEPVEVPVSETKNESDDNKERSMIIKLKKKVKILNVALQEAEEMIIVRDKELADIASQLQEVQSEEGIRALLEGLKNKKRQLKFKDDGIKSLVQEVNTLNQLVDELQLENETFRKKLNIPPEEKIPTKGILKKLYETEEKHNKISKYLKKMENKLTQAQFNNRILKTNCNKMINLLTEVGCAKEKIDAIIQESEFNTDVENDGMSCEFGSQRSLDLKKEKPIRCNCEAEMQSIADENEGLRKGLQEILNFLKDNSTTSSGILSLECPSLDAILQSMEARHASGWFGPHMAAVMELRAALGGRDALLTALHEARKETFEVMAKLSYESKKSKELEHKLEEIGSKEKLEIKNDESDTKMFEFSSKITMNEFGSWMSFEEDSKIDFNNKSQVESHLVKRNASYEDYLKKVLGYFHEKFKTLFEKMTSIVVQSADQQNKWSIQEEQYKAQIENLRGQLTQQEEEDISEDSPGLIPIHNSSFLERKCSYLEESYKYIRTTNENMKNEILESKKESMLVTLDYETQIQSLMLIIANLFDKLRSSISIELFWNQNAVLNQAVVKQRKMLEENLKKEETYDFLKNLEDQKIDILNNLKNDLQNINGQHYKDELKKNLNSAEQSIMKRQLEELCAELEKKDSIIKVLESKNMELQELQAKLIDNNMETTTKEEINLMKTQSHKLAEENKLLKEQCQHIESKLDIALLQLQDRQQRQMSCDMEINMLRHQILDLQAVGDNKAIIARLSGEVLVAHLQASESHKRIERLSASLNKEKQSRVEAEEMLQARQKIFDIYAFRYESKFRYMYEVMQVLRQQYHGGLPIASIENYLNKVEDLNRKTRAADEKLQDIEDLQFRLMTKHSVFEQILDLSKNKCIEEKDGCSHKLKNIVMEGIHSREEIHYHKKLNILEHSRIELLKYCNDLENTLVLVNQGFEKSNIVTKKINGEDVHNMELEDIQSDEESNTRKSQTVTLEKPQVLKPSQPAIASSDDDNKKIGIKPSKPNSQPSNEKVDKANVFVQTESTILQKEVKLIQTEADQEKSVLKSKIVVLKTENEKIKKELNDTMVLTNRYIDDINKIHGEQINMKTKIENLIDSNHQKDMVNERLRIALEELKRQNDDFRSVQITHRNKLRDAANEENKSLLIAIKQLENDKNSIISEYQELLHIERDEFSKSMKELNSKIRELQHKLDSKESDTNSYNAEATKEVISKYTTKIATLEDKCFKAQSEIDSCRTELTTYRCEVNRWKDLANERLTKMEQLNSQLEERHSHEVESYKAENQHWMTQMNETQREHLELRSKLTEQKAQYVKQLSDKDSIIEQLRSTVYNLKTQILSMQTMISVNDPSFDLSAIMEVDESSDMTSHHGSERLELKYVSTNDLRNMDDVMRMPATSTAIWQDPVIERLRQEKQSVSKQNEILRRQIKALAARERRSRLDAQNLKNQVFRISTSGSRAVTAESQALQSKIATLQAQLTNVRRDSSNSSLALWDKWKRSQQSAERWQARYDEKCHEIKKLEGSLSLAKSAVARLEKEKHILLTRLNEIKHEKPHTAEKQVGIALDRSHRSSELTTPPVSARALFDRVQAQQRRIAALEVAERGNETLVAEYEKLLAEITSLKGHVLKLESTLLEAQIRAPIQSTQNAQPEIDHWKSYCEMLKKENEQLNMKVNALGTTPTTANQQRIYDQEQTILTLRGLVSKLQAEQKSSSSQKRADSRPIHVSNSGMSSTSGIDKSHKQVESHRLEIINLRRSLQEKDLLLEKSKEMLKIAAEREDDLLRENEFLRRRLEELTSHKSGYRSA